MKNQKENSVQPEKQTAGKKPYQAPELTVHGRVDTITKFLVSTIGHLRHH